MDGPTWKTTRFQGLCKIYTFFPLGICEYAPRPQDSGTFRDILKTVIFETKVGNNHSPSLFGLFRSFKKIFSHEKMLVRMEGYGKCEKTLFVCSDMQSNDKELSRNSFLCLRSKTSGTLNDYPFITLYPFISSRRDLNIWGLYGFDALMRLSLNTHKLDNLVGHWRRWRINLAL